MRAKADLDAAKLHLGQPEQIKHIRIVRQEFQRRPAAALCLGKALRTVVHRGNGQNVAAAERSRRKHHDPFGPRRW